MTNATAKASGIASEEATALCRGPTGSTSLERRASSFVREETPSGQLRRRLLVL